MQYTPFDLRVTQSQIDILTSYGILTTPPSDGKPVRHWTPFGATSRAVTLETGESCILITPNSFLDPQTIRILLNTEKSPPSIKKIE